MPASSLRREGLPPAPPTSQTADCPPQPPVLTTGLWGSCGLCLSAGRVRGPISTALPPSQGSGHLAAGRTRVTPC